MNKSVVELQAIASAGGGIILDATYLSAVDLQGIASAAKRGQATIIMKNITMKSSIELQGIASAGGGYVIFDLT